MQLPTEGDASGRTLGDEELALVREVIESGTLNSTRGTQVQAFERDFADWLGTEHAVACSSGSAAVHVCVQAIGLRPGDEVVTTPITDMGAITPILYEGGIPVFADVDPRTLMVTASGVEAALTERTRAVVATHLFGMPCEIEALAALCRNRDLLLIEDCAQAFGATVSGRKVGTFGDLAAFSLQQGKHITTGEGGIATTGDADRQRTLFLAVNKAWGYGDECPDHYFPALNYRMTELQGAVARAQLAKLDGVVAARRRIAEGLRRRLDGVPGLRLPGDPPGGTHAWWKFAPTVDPARIRGGATELGGALRAAGVHCMPRYIQKPAFECALFRDWSRSPVTSMPLAHNPRGRGSQPPFVRDDFPGAIQGLDEVLVLPINERYTDSHVAFVAETIATACGALTDA